MLNNNRFSQVRISYVLRFMNICDLFTDSSSYARPCLCMRTSEHSSSKYVTDMHVSLYPVSDNSIMSSHLHFGVVLFI
jgi:hypothetical protein